MRRGAPMMHENVALSPQVSCAALSGLLPLDARFPGREPWVENRRSQALKGDTETHKWFGAAIGSIFEAEVAKAAESFCI